MQHPIDQATLKTLLHYDPLTGIFVRLKRGKGKRGKGNRAGHIHRSASRKRYRKISFGTGPERRFYYEHRLAYLYMTGKFPPQQIDHIDGDGLNNAWRNLRPVTQRENSWNMQTPISNTSGHIGVSWEERRNKWRVRMHNPKRSPFIGRFTRFDDAVAARIAAEDMYRNGIRFNGVCD